MGNTAFLLLSVNVDIPRDIPWQRGIMHSPRQIERHV